MAMRETRDAGPWVVSEQAQALEQISGPLGFYDGEGEATDNEWGDVTIGRGVGGNDDDNDAATDVSAVTDARYAPDVADLRDFHDGHDG
jgi:hypothetical protein